MDGVTSVRLTPEEVTDSLTVREVATRVRQLVRLAAVHAAVCGANLEQVGKLHHLRRCSKARSSPLSSTGDQGVRTPSGSVRAGGAVGVVVVALVHDPLGFLELLRVDDPRMCVGGDMLRIADTIECFG